MTKTQATTIATLRRMLASGPVDVTYGGLKGVNRNSLYALVDQGVIIVERHPVANRNYPDVFVTAIND